MPQLVAAIIFPAYAAAVVSFLTVHIQTYPFEDLDGMLKDGTYRIGYLKVDFFCRSLVHVSDANGINWIDGLYCRGMKNYGNFKSRGMN